MRSLLTKRLNLSSLVMVAFTIAQSRKAAHAQRAPVSAPEAFVSLLRLEVCE